ncbi:oligosaccharide flippase family protein [Polynucleobacter sinensis]|uniref:oligosaccharide flippase family protein n=1 Tax=Polynucleobacter sinensis TaxID=1743157 RepID=UPI00155EFD5E|nr:oligosaccharide flippase family protein [Polynucleobacter sinensis]
MLLISPFDKKFSQSRVGERYTRIFRTVLSSLAIRGFGIVAAVVTTPLTLGYLGADRFGIWMTINSITALLSFADFGVGGGLLNAISKADGRGDRVEAQRAVSNAFVVLVIVALILATCSLLAYEWLSWGTIFDLSNEGEVDEVRNAVAILLACTVVSLPLSTVHRVQHGFQEGLQNNLWQAVINIGSTVGIICAAFSQASLPWLVLASSGVPVLVTLVNCIYEFYFNRQWLRPRISFFSSKIARDFLQTGSYFAALQLLAFVGFFSDNFVIGKILGSGAVAAYAVVFKLYSTIFIVQFIMVPLWPALNETISRGELSEARQIYERAKIYCLIGGVVIASILIIFGRPLIEVWVGGDFIPSWALITGFAVWSLIASYYATISALLSGHSLNKLLRVICAAAIISFVLKIIMITWFGVSGAIWAAVLGYGILIFYARQLTQRVLGYL